MLLWNLRVLPNTLHDQCEKLGYSKLRYVFEMCQIIEHKNMFNHFLSVFENEGELWCTEIITAFVGATCLSV